MGGNEKRTRLERTDNLNDNLRSHLKEGLRMTSTFNSYSIPCFEEMLVTNEATLVVKYL